MKAWLDHLFNDPIRTNPWSIVALSVIVTAILTGMALLSWGVRRIRFLGKKEPETMDDRAQADDTIKAARADYEGNAPEPAHTGDALEASAGRLGLAESTMDYFGLTPRPKTLADLPDPVATGRSFTDAAFGRLTDEPEPQGPRMSTPPSALTDSGVHALPEAPAAKVMRMDCEHCGGTGYVEMTVNDLLRESIALIPEGGGDMVVKEFYTQLLAAAPNLAEIFPADLLTTDETRHQRDKLYEALAALSTLYDPQDADKMTRLRNAAGSFGRSHASFYRPSEDATRGASLEEYAAVKAILMATFHAVAGDAWKTAYDAAWSEAFDHLTGMMLDAQHSTPMTAPRFPRQ